MQENRETYITQYISFVYYVTRREQVHSGMEMRLPSMLLISGMIARKSNSDRCGVDRTENETIPKENTFNGWNISRSTTEQKTKSYQKANVHYFSCCSFRRGARLSGLKAFSLSKLSFATKTTGSVFSLFADLAFATLLSGPSRMEQMLDCWN